MVMKQGAVKFSHGLLHTHLGSIHNANRRIMSIIACRYHLSWYSPIYRHANNVLYVGQ